MLLQWENIIYLKNPKIVRFEQEEQEDDLVNKITMKLKFEDIEQHFLLLLLFFLLLLFILLCSMLSFTELRFLVFAVGADINQISKVS